MLLTSYSSIFTPVLGLRDHKPSAPCIAETSKNNTSTDKSFMRKSRYVNPQTVSQIPVPCIASGINILFAIVDINNCE